MKRAAFLIPLLLAGCVPPTPPEPTGPETAPPVAAPSTTTPSGPAPGEPAPAESAKSPRVLAHYMPWFRMEITTNGATRWEHWLWFGKGKKHDPDDVLENGRRDISSIYYPLIGPYHGADRDVIEYHMRTAQAAGIEGFVADWYGPDTYTDMVFSNMVGVAERCGFTLAICLEEKSFFPGYSKAATRAEAQDLMVRYIRHVLGVHAKSPAYFRSEGRPVFFIFNNFESGVLGRHVFTPDEVSNVLARLPEKILLVRGHYETNYFSVARGAYAWVGDAKYRRDFYDIAGEARASGSLELVAGVANPGFDDSGVWGWGKVPRATDRRGTKEFEEQWADVLKNKPDVVQIVTWNDFEEGTTIEPAEPYGFAFVNLTEEYVGRLNGRPVDLSDNEEPWRRYQSLKRNGEK